MIWLRAAPPSLAYLEFLDPYYVLVRPILCSKPPHGSRPCPPLHLRRAEPLPARESSTATKMARNAAFAALAVLLCAAAASGVRPCPQLSRAALAHAVAGSALTLHG